MNKSRKFAALVVITILLTGICQNVWAQYDEGEDPLYIPEKRLFYAGLIGGANFSQVDGDNFAGYHKIGANVGGIGYVQLKKHLALSWEFLFSQKGAKSDIVRQSPADTFFIIKNYGVTLNYAEIPVMINYFDKRKSHAGIGVAYSRLVGSNESYETIPYLPLDLNKYQYSKDNFDLIVGAQMHLWKGLFLNIRFAYSLVPIRTVSPPVISRASKQYSNLWTVRLMYLLI